MLLLTACATSSHNSVLKIAEEKPFNRILVVLTDDELKLTTFDSAFYVNHVQGHFNTLEDIRFRGQLERTIQRNLESKGTVVIKSSDVFPINDAIGYSTFQKSLTDLQINAILLINLRGYWTTLHTNNDGNVTSEPNASFNSYLIKTSNEEIVWMGHTVIRGIYAGFDTLNNSLARKIAASLRKEKLIYPADPITKK